MIDLRLIVSADINVCIFIIYLLKYKLSLSEYHIYLAFKLFQDYFYTSIFGIFSYVQVTEKIYSRRILSP